MNRVVAKTRIPGAAEKKKVLRTWTNWSVRCRTSSAACSANGGGGGGPRRSGPAMGFGVGLLIVIAAIIWLLSGIYIVDPAERGVVLRFGQYQSTVGAGPHWHLPYPIEQVYKVNVDAVRDVKHHAQMLTKDENLMSIALAVQYQVKNAEDYLFNVRDPDYTLKEVTESALREVVGTKRLDDILSESGGREVLVTEAESRIQQLVDRYGAGLRVTKVNLENAQPPEQVQAAFEDAIKAREDEDRFKKQAEGYARDIIPKAEGDAERLEQEAEAYRRQVVDRARGDTSRFQQVLNEYKKAPEITRKRLYLETMEDVMSRVSKVLVKVNKGNNVLYLPLDQYRAQQEQWFGRRWAPRCRRCAIISTRVRLCGSVQIDPTTVTVHGRVADVRLTYVLTDCVGDRAGVALDVGVRGQRARIGDQVPFGRNRPFRLQAGPALPDSVDQQRAQVRQAHLDAAIPIPNGS